MLRASCLTAAVSHINLYAHRMTKTSGTAKATDNEPFKVIDEIGCLIKKSCDYQPLHTVV